MTIILFETKYILAALIFYIMIKLFRYDLFGLIGSFYGYREHATMLFKLTGRRNKEELLIVGNQFGSDLKSKL
jgi:hypothetical protein